MSPGPADDGGFLTPGFVQALDVWGDYVRRGRGELRAGAKAAWWLFELYGIDPPTQPPTLAEQDALATVLQIPPRSRVFSLEQVNAIHTARSYLERTCPGVDANASRPDGSPYTLQEAADDLASAHVPPVPAEDLEPSPGSGWANYEVRADGPLTDVYWNTAPGGSDVSTIATQLQDVRIPVDDGDYVTPGFCQALDVWGRYLTRGDGVLGGSEMAAWYLFELYGVDPPTRAPTLEEQRAMATVLAIEPGARLSREQSRDVVAVHAYLSDACPDVAQNWGRPPDTPYTLQGAADRLLAAANSRELPTVPASVTAAADPGWAEYQVLPKGPLEDTYWDTAPGGSNLTSIDNALENVTLPEGV